MTIAWWGAPGAGMTIASWGAPGEGVTIPWWGAPSATGNPVLVKPAEWSPSANVFVAIEEA